MSAPAELPFDLDSLPPAVREAFAAMQANFTYIWTAQGWLYVAVVLDLFSRRVVGWSMKAERDATLVMDALMMAVWRRGKADALLHHSDQGSQYTSEQFQRLLADNGITCSMSRAGNVWDNSPMESFFSSLKIERTLKTAWARSDTQSFGYSPTARSIGPATKPVPTCLTTSSSSTTRAGGTRSSATSAPWNSRPALC